MSDDLPPGLTRDAPPPPVSVADAGLPPGLTRAQPAQPVNSEISDAVTNDSGAGRVLDAFGQGLKDGWGADRLGFSKDTEQWLSHIGLFNGPEHPKTILRLFHEALMRPAAAGLDAVLNRLPNAAYTAVGNAAETAAGEVGPGTQRLVRDVVAMPQAFMGSPGSLKPVDIAKARDLGVIGPDKPPLSEGTPVEAARAAVQPPTAIAVPPESAAQAIAIENGKFSYPIRGGGQITGDVNGGTFKVFISAAMDKGAGAGTEAYANLAREVLSRGAILESDRAVSAAAARVYEKLGEQGFTVEKNKFSEMSKSGGETGEGWVYRVTGAPDDVATEPHLAAQPAEMPPNETVRGPAAATDKAGNIRLDLLDISNDAKDLIRQAAEENDGFMPARRGEISLAQADAVSQATGIPLDTLNTKGVGRVLQNDSMVRTYIQAMLQSGDGVLEAAKKAALTDDPADLAALQQARMRHSALVEQVSGLTAEWGRTGNVFQEFGEQVKDNQSLGRFLKDKKGESVDDLRDLAKSLANTDTREGRAKLLAATRKPNWQDKLLYYWTNGLLSGPFTHTAYALSNAAFATYEGAVVTPIAGAIGKGMDLIGRGDGERVMMGEGAARLWGMAAGIPEAFRAAGRAIRDNVPQTIKGVDERTGRNPVTQIAPIQGKAGAIIGVPQRVILGIHSFYHILGERAELHAEAYRQAAKENLSPFGHDFWARTSDLAANPTDEAFDHAVANGDRLTFTAELGDTGKAFQSLVKKTFLGRFVFPFIRTPADIFKAAQEGTPLAFLDKDMRDNLLGRNGAVARDTQWARLTAGSAVGALAVNWAMNGNITGGGPTDPTERADWLLTHKPYSVRIAGHWLDYHKFGALGMLLGIGADLHDVGHDVGEGDYDKAAGLFTKAASNAVLEQTFMTGLSDLVSALQDPEREGARYLRNMAASFTPFTTLTAQVASATDPDVRDAKTFVDALKMKTPFLRQTIAPKRDVWGNPVPNDRYRLGAVIGNRQINNDPASLELQRLDIRPAPAEARIKGVKLDPKLYDEYQVKAGVLAHTLVSNLVNNPAWRQIPDYTAKETISNSIRTARSMAAAQMQMAHPDLIMQALKQQTDRISGVAK